MLKVTHLSQRRSACPWPDEFGEGWFIRFAGDLEDFNTFKEELKSWGRREARWIPVYRWDDGKQGAWWVAEQAMSEVCEAMPQTDRFMRLLEDQPHLQWIRRGRSSYTSSPSSSDFADGERDRDRDRFTRSNSSTHTTDARRSVPLRLRHEYTLLQLSDNATLNDCKEAYRRLAKVYHPDAGGSHTGFIALQRAYEAVKNYLSIIAA